MNTSALEATTPNPHSQKAAGDSNVVGQFGGTPAGFLQQSLAFGIDCIIVFVAAHFLWALISIAGVPRDKNFARLSAIVVYLVVSCVYSTWCVGGRGATFGKQALSIRVVRSNGQYLGYWRALLRFWAKWLTLPPLTFWIAFFDPLRRTLHDRIADSATIRVESLSQPRSIAEVDLKPAKLLDRMLAFGIDCMVVFIVGFFFQAIIPKTWWPSECGDLLARIGAYFLVSCIYSTSFLGTGGATPGKQALYIRVVRSNGQRLGYWWALLRFWAKCFTLPPLTFWIAFFDPLRRTLHDRIADSVVIRAEYLQQDAFLGSANLRAAGFWIRAAALSIDAAFVATFSSACFLLKIWLEDHYGTLKIEQNVVITLVGAGYNWLFLTLWSTTPGKMVFELGVVRRNAEVLTALSAFARYLAFWGLFALGVILPIPERIRGNGIVMLAIMIGVPFLGSVMAVFDPQRRALHDRICGTRVIHLD